MMTDPAVTIVQPAPFYRCLAAQTWLLIAAATLVFHWYAVAIAETLTAHYPTAGYWWSLLELVVRAALLPLLTSFCYAYADAVLDREHISQWAFLAGPIAMAARWLALPGLTLGQWLFWGYVIMLAAHMALHGRTYWASLRMWANREHETRLALDDFNLEVHRLMQAIHVHRSFLLPPEQEEIQLTRATSATDCYIFAPSLNEAKQELHATCSRLQAMLANAHRRKREPLARRRLSLAAKRRRLKPLYEAHVARGDGTYPQFARQWRVDLFQGEPDPAQWEVLSSDYIDYVAGQTEKFFVDCADHAQYVGVSKRTQIENELRLAYGTYEDLVESFLSRADFERLLREAQENIGLTEYGEHMSRLNDRLQTAAHRQMLRDKYDAYAETLAADYPREVFESQLATLFPNDLSLVEISSHGDAIIKMIDEVTRPTREQMEEELRQREELLRQECRRGFEIYIIAVAEEVRRIEADLEMTRQSASRPDVKAKYTAHLEEKLRQVRNDVARKRNEDSALFDEVCQRHQFAMANA